MRGDFVAHLAILRANAAHGGRSHEPVVVANPRTSNSFQASVFHQRRCLFDHLDVGFFENDFLPRALTAGLFAGLLRPCDHRAFAEGVETADQHLPEAAAVGDQQRDRRDSPHDAEHGEQAASEVAAQGHPRFEEYFGEHDLAARLEAQSFDRINRCCFPRGI